MSSAVSKFSSMVLLGLVASSRIIHAFASHSSYVQADFLQQHNFLIHESKYLSTSKINMSNQQRHFKTNKKKYTLQERNPYDVHVYYDIPNQEEKAMELREKLKVQFPWMRFYQPRNHPIGPHPIPMFEADFGKYENHELLDQVCDFLEKEHGDLSILIHPHSTDGAYADHTKNAIWFGETLNLLINNWRNKLR